MASQMVQVLCKLVLECRFHFVEEQIFVSVFKICRMKMFLGKQWFAKFKFIILVCDLICFFLNTVLILPKNWPLE